jgi:molybdopterin molybdotransferase
VSALVPLVEAQALVLSRCALLEAERVPIAAAVGRVTAEDVPSAVDLPPFPSSAMDGFALRGADTPGRLAVVGHVAAGAPETRPLGAGEAMAISTGGVVPDGADAIAQIEIVSVDGSTVEVAEAIAAGTHVRPRGGDVTAGDVVVPAGVRLGAPQVGALAAAGVADVSCARGPHVAILATGSELVSPGAPLGPGQVYEANTLMLAAALAAAGAQVERLPAVADDEDAHRAAIERGLAADVLVTSGGVSVGPHDLVRRIEAELGVEEVFWQVAVKPGKPVAFGVRGRTLVFGLPGNPVSSLVGCELLVKPALRALQGLADPLPRLERGTLATALRRNAARDEFARARLTGDVLEPLSGQESHMIARAAAADALVHVERGEGMLDAGARVGFLRL